MNHVSTQLLAVLSVGIGGGSLVLFVYFLIFGAPVRITIADSDAECLAFDALLCLGFFVQHSGMIRRSAKQRLANRIPSFYHPALYSIASGICLLVLVLAWQPTSSYLFHLQGPARWFSAAAALLAVAGFVWGVHSLRGFDPFGTLPLKAASRGTSAPAFAFVARGPYRYVRHPLYLFMLLLICSTPRFSTDQLLFNVLWTAWIIVGTRLEERDLLLDFGQTYRQYQASVPMLLPSHRTLLRRHSADWHQRGDSP